MGAPSRPFTLRKPEGAWRCAISEARYDDAWDAFAEDVAVTVLGVESKSRGVINVLSIEAASEGGADG